MQRLPTRVPYASLALCLLASGFAASAGAQDTPTPRPTPVVPEAYRYTVGGSPFLPLAGVVSGEIEASLGAAGVSFGVGGFLDFSGDNNRYSSLQAKLKYYPNEVTLKGFAVGATLGVFSARDEDNGDYVCGPFGCNSGPLSRTTDTKPTFGVVIDYNWLLGRQKRFLVGAGVGARRVIGKVESSSPLEQTLPDGRLVIGWAF